MIIIEVVVGVICICDRIVQQVFSMQGEISSHSLTESLDPGKITLVSLPKVYQDLHQL